MKTQNHYSSIRTYGLIAILLLLSACGKYVLEENLEEESASKGYQMSLKVRSGGLELEQYYPLSVYLFNENGELVEKKEITDTNETYSKTLEKGQYTLTAFSGLSEDSYTIPDNPTTTDYIQFKSRNPLPAPLLFGQSRVSLTEDTQVNISLSYTMAALNFNLEMVPDDATAVEIQVSPVSSGMSFTGNYNNDNQSFSIKCFPTDKGWETDTYYILPSESSRTNLSITIKRPEGNETYSYTYTDMLQPAQPYHFTGTYQEGVSMGSTFEIEGWKPSIGVDFNLNENASGEENEDDTETILRAPQLPVADKIWGYFYVWKVEAVSETEVIATLISPDQWYVLAADALDIIESYSIDGIDNWRMFTEEEAREIRKQFALTLDDLNYYLDQNGLDRFYRNEDERYLCDEARKSFGFNSDRITTAGNKTEYYLRGVKTVRVKLEE